MVVVFGMGLGDANPQVAPSFRGKNDESCQKAKNFAKNSFILDTLYPNTILLYTREKYNGYNVFLYRKFSRKFLAF